MGWTAFLSASPPVGDLPSRRGHEDFLRQVVPAVQFQDPLVVSSEGASRLCFPEYPGAGSDEVVVEEPLVEAPLKPLPVDGVERLPASVNAQESVAGFAFCDSVYELLKCVALYPLCG